MTDSIGSGTPWPGTESYEQNLRDFCSSLFDTLPRADQRRSGEAYVRGLLGGHGRKSIRRIAIQHVGGYSDQSLQQFVNQSPWNPEPVRQRLARMVADALSPSAWVLEEAVFLKHGRHSAAVERQFVPSRGRVCNCQLGVSVLLANEQVSVPVHWLLAIPLSWDRDEIRRDRARIPPEVRSRPFWQYQIEALDDMSGDWGIPPAPAIIDARSTTALPELLAELDSRCLDYLVEVSGNAAAQWRSGPPAVPPGHQGAPYGGQGGYGGLYGPNGYGPSGHNGYGGHNGQGSYSGSAAALAGLVGPVSAAGAAVVDGSAGHGAGRHGTLAELARTAPQPERRLVAWREPLRGRTMRAQFSALPTVSMGGNGQRGGPGHPARPPRLLLVEWPLGKSEPRGFWITNMVDRPVPELTALAKLRLRAQQDLELLTGRFGLCDYEGRSFLGWHHHVTLASMAYAFDRLHRLPGRVGEEVAHAVGD